MTVPFDVSTLSSALAASAALVGVLSPQGAPSAPSKIAAPSLRGDTSDQFGTRESPTDWELRVRYHQSLQELRETNVALGD